MASGLNRVSLIGNLGKDPEIRHSQSGVAVATLRLGVTEKRKEGDSYKDHTEWVSVITFGKTAENANKYLQKGRQVFVEGKLQTRQWEDKTGAKRYTTEVVASQLLFLGSNNSSSSSSFTNSDRGFGSTQDEREEENTFIDDDEIPF